MRGQSYSNKKNNSNKEDFQGGETKVMKKSLKMLLVFALVFSMFAPAMGFAAEAEMDTQAKFDAMLEAGILEGIDGEAALDKNMQRNEVAKILANIFELEVVAGAPTSFPDEPADNWGYTDGYIQAVVAAGLMQGGSKEDGTVGFRPNAQLSLQELAVVLDRALDLPAGDEVEGKTSSWATAAVAAVVADGLLPASADYTVDATRADLVSSTYEVYVAYEEAMAEEAKAGLATDVKSVTADNLAQAYVEFNGQVDKASAEDADNYVISGKTVKSATLAEDGVKVTLTLDTTVANSQFSNQTEYSLNVNNVKAGDNTIQVSNLKFTPADSTLPTVESVEALGNKTIRVVFNEPISKADISSFKIDDKQVVGFTTIVGNTVMVRTFSTLTDGEHTLNVINVEDFAGYKSISTTHTVAVVADTTAPTIDSVVGATFEKVTLMFSEPIDPAIVFGSNVYWLQGSTKMYAQSTVIQVSDDTFEFHFGANERMTFTTDLYVTGIKDYSGNTIAADSKIAVSPVIDQVRPQVASAEINNAGTEFTVKFTKNLDVDSAEKAANYVVKNASGTVYSPLKEATLQADNKTVKIELSVPLNQGATYTLEVAGVTDNTILKNGMLPYTKSFTIGDVTAPEVDRVATSGTRLLVVTFSEAMAVSGDGSIVDPARYFYKDGFPNLKSLPSGTLLNVTPDGKSALITFPATVNGAAFNVSTITEFRVQLVKDLDGNYLNGLSYDTTIIEAATQASVTGSVYATATDKISVAFDQTLLANSINVNDFRVIAGGATSLAIVNAELSATNANTVILTLSGANKLSANGRYNVSDVTVQTVANVTTSTPEGTTIVPSQTSVVAGDKIKASVLGIASAAGSNKIRLSFNENLATFVATGTSQATDIVVKRGSTILTPGTGYVVAVEVGGANENVLVITLLGAPTTGVYSVEVVNPRFLKDAVGNVVNASSAHLVNVQ